MAFDVSRVFKNTRSAGCWVLGLLVTSSLVPAATPSATIVRDPDHEFDFRGCANGSSSWAFPGSSTAYYFKSATNFVLPSEWTIETWVKLTATTDTVNHWLSWATSTANQNCLLLKDYMFTVVDEWYYVVVTSDGPSMVVYINGKATTNGIYIDSNFASTGNNWCGDTTGSLVFGQDQDSVGGGFQAYQALGMEQDTVAIYSKAWSASAVQTAKAAVDTSDANLYALWTGTSGTDLTGHGNTATIVFDGSPTVARVADTYNASIVATTYDGANLSPIPLPGDGFLPVVDSFCYLGDMIARDGSDTEAVDGRAEAGSCAFGALRGCEAWLPQCGWWTPFLAVMAGLAAVRAVSLRWSAG